MKNTVVLFCLFLILACSQSVVETTEGDFITKKALLINQLAVDGCSWHFGVAMGDEWGQYVADEKSRTLVDPLIQKANTAGGTHSIPVEITFRLTGKKQDVLCGWGTKASMDEIEIQQIKEI